MTVRTYRHREDAEHARRALADREINAEVREHFVADRFTGARTSLGCSLMVASADVTEAARVLLRLPPAESAARRDGGPRTTTRAKSPATRGVNPGFKERSPLWIVVLAVACSAGVMIWLVDWIVGLRADRVPLPGPDAENYVATDDVNGDGLVDTEREYTPDGRVLLQIREDRNYDGLMDVRWIWQRGVLAYRDRDIDFNGVMDERTTFDGADRPFYIDLRPNGEGPVIRREVYREGVLWKILEDRDADNHFDFIREFDREGKRVVREEALPKGSPENDIPKRVPLPPEEPEPASPDDGEPEENASPLSDP